MRSRILVSVTAVLAAGTVLACQRDLTTAAKSATTPSLSPTGGYGQPVQAGVFQGQVTGSVCSIPVTEQVVEGGAAFVAGPSGTRTKHAGIAKLIMTNPDNGKTLEWLSAGPSTTEITAVNPDGSFMVTQTFDGLGPLLKELSGPVLFFDAGHAIISGIITPLPDGTFQGHILSVTLDGPHPAMPGSPSFCTVVDGALL